MEFKNSQLWITLPNLNAPGGCTVFPQGEEANTDAGTTFTQSSFHFPSGLTPVENACVDHHGVSMDTEFPFGTARELRFINSFYCLILLFCGAQLQILYTRVHKVSFLFATLCLRSDCLLLLERSNVKNVHLIIQAVFAQK